MNYTTRSALSAEDKYALLQGENARLRRSIERLAETLSHYRELSTYLQGEVEYWREKAQEITNESL